jgi:hypothetical protein
MRNSKLRLHCNNSKWLLSPANKSDVQGTFFVQQMSAERTRNAGIDVLKATALLSHGNTKTLPSCQPSKSNSDIKYGDEAMRGTIQFKQPYSVM